MSALRAADVARGGTGRRAGTRGLAGTGTLIRHVLRRDRVRFVVWTLVIALLPVLVYSTYERVYPTPQARQQLTESAGSAPSILVLYGPSTDLSTAGSFTAWRVGMFLGVLVAIFTVLTVVRHTRAEEDSGRAELVASGVVGRYAPLTAAVTISLATSTVAGLLDAITLIGSGAATAGSLALGAAVAATGAVFTGVAAIAAQLASYARTANTLGLAVLGVAFLVRAVGDANGPTWLSWLSPLAWISQVRAFTDDRWQVLGLPAAASLPLLTVATTLLRDRDAGLGLIAPREGRSSASPALSGTFGLAWRLGRGTLIGWAVGYVVFGAVLGSLTGSIGDLLGGDQAKEMFAVMGLDDLLAVLYIAAVMPILGTVAVLYGVLAISRARSEEVEHRLEPVLATPVSRVRWFTSHLLMSVGGTAVLLAVGGAAVAAGALASAPHTSLTSGAILGGALVQIPAASVSVALAALLFGVVPRLGVLGWVAAGFALVVTWLGPTLGWSQRVLQLSPFEHLPAVPAESVTAGPLAGLTAVAAVLVGAAVLGIWRRDLE